MFFDQRIRMISEGSCDTKDWSNDAENLHHWNELLFNYMKQQPKSVRDFFNIMYIYIYIYYTIYTHNVFIISQNLL